MFIHFLGLCFLQLAMHYAELWSIALVPSECAMFYFLFSQRMEKSEVELVREEGEEDLLLEQEKT